MPRLIRLTSIVVSAALLALAAAACGSQNISIPRADASYKADYAAAKIFNERCGGCHTLSYAATNGSGNNPRTYLAISGPNFNVRCERPVARVLYAIENGGFGGAYMPANIVVGRQAREVAMFVSRFAGRQAPVQPDTTPCVKQPIGQLPASMTGGVNLKTTTNAVGVTSTSTTVSNASPTAKTAKKTHPSSLVPSSSQAKTLSKSTTTPQSKTTQNK